MRNAPPGRAAVAGLALYHEGYVFVGDMARGLDVYELNDPELIVKLKPKKLLP